MWQLFPTYTVGIFIGLALVYVVGALIEHFSSYHGMSKRTKRRFVFWGLKLLEFTAVIFVIEMAIEIMGLGTSGGFFHTTAKLAFSILIPLVLLLLIAGTAWLFVMLCKGFVIVVKKIRKDIVHDIKRFFGSLARMWTRFVKANKDYAEVITEQGCIHSIVYFGELKWEVGRKQKQKHREELQLEKEAEERSERIRQAEKEANEIHKPTIKPLWYPLEDKEES